MKRRRSTLRSLTPCPPLPDGRGGTHAKGFAEKPAPINKAGCESSPLARQGEGAGGEASEGIPLRLLHNLDTANPYLLKP